MEDPRLVFAPEEVAAKILYYIIETAAKTTFHGKANIKAVVVTVPAYFSDQQRQATRAACEVAIALNELSSKVYIINEPTAALFAHWVNSGLKAGAAAIDFAEWLVVDIGGGTTDLSAVSVQLDQQDGHQRLKVRATAGNNDLGGRNIDRRMQDWALQKIRKVGFTQRQGEWDKHALRLKHVGCTLRCTAVRTRCPIPDTTGCTCVNTVFGSLQLCTWQVLDDYGATCHWFQGANNNATDIQLVVAL